MKGGRPVKASVAAEHHGIDIHIGGSLELLAGQRGCVDAQVAIGDLDVEGGPVHEHFLLADAEEAADLDNHRRDLPLGVDDEVFDLADLRAIDAIDILIVQINPLRRDDVPRTAREIINRVNEISFNTSLIKELRTLGLLRRLVEEGHVTVRQERRLHLHMIHGEEDLQKLAASSKMNTEWHYLRHLFERGRLWAQDWLDRHLDDVGARSSFRLEEMFAPSSKVV